ALSSSMRELNGCRGAVGVDEPHDALQFLDVCVLPDPEIFGTDPAVSGDGGGFGEDKCGAADRAAAEMDEVPLVCEPVDARVLTHRRNQYPIGERQPAQRERFEEMRHRQPLSPKRRLR